MSRAGGAAGTGASARGTLLQRARVGLLDVLVFVLGHLPAGVADGLADVGGELWYRAAPGRAAMARGNLGHVVAVLAADGRAGPRVRRAARDPAALERLVRSTFRHAVRTYTEFLRGRRGWEDIGRRTVVESPEAEAAFAADRAAIFASLHFGSLLGGAAVIATRASVPITAPMETLDDPAMQRFLERVRGFAGTRIIGLHGARHTLRAALARGEAVGLVSDRDLGGGGLSTPFFGLPASLPFGPAYLALEAGVPIHVGTVHRVGGRFLGRIITLPHPPAGLPRRTRIELLLAAEARAFEDLIAAAPDQWTAVFYPIWEGVGPRRRGSPAVHAAAGPAPDAAPGPAPDAAPGSAPDAAPGPGGTP